MQAGWYLTCDLPLCREMLGEEWHKEDSPSC